MGVMMDDFSSAGQMAALVRAREILGEKASVWSFSGQYTNKGPQCRVWVEGVETPTFATFDAALEYAEQHRDEILAQRAERLKVWAAEREARRIEAELQAKEYEAKQERERIERNEERRARIRGAVAEARAILGDPYDPLATVTLAGMLLANVEGKF